MARQSSPRTVVAVPTPAPAAPDRTERLSAAEIAEALEGRRTGDGWSARCPAHDDGTPSLSIGEGNGRVLVKCHAGCEQSAVLAALRARRLWPDAPRAIPRRPPDRIWLYANAGGAVVRRTARWDLPGGGKVVRPQTPDGRGGWRTVEMHGPRPLYRLPDLSMRPDAVVIVTEGEPAADAAAAMLPEHFATTSAGGAQAAECTDWTPLRGRALIIWPDSDPAGAAYASDVARLAHNAGAVQVRVVALPDELPRGWDLANPLPHGWTVERVRGLLRTAELAAPADSVELSASERPDTDTSTARRFVDQFGDRIRQCDELGGWLHYGGGRWERKATAAVYQRLAETVESIWAEVPNAPEQRRKDLARFAIYAASARGQASALALARYMPPLPAKVSEFDRDPFLLNATNGTIDLRTGTLRPHYNGDLITKRLAVAYDASATCPTWLKFLEVVFPDDPDLIAYVQRALGYSCSGDVSEHVLFFAHGAGRNGKSTMLGTVQGVLGDYAHTADPELLLQRTGAAHPTNIAGLRGARFVTSIEAEDGRRFAEVLVKWLTGGDRLTARHMHQDFFEFDPTHHLWLAANHRPQVRGADAGIWARIHLIPFAVHLPSALGDQYDPRFRDRLISESQGILRWLVDGCLAWQREGLRPPAAVQAATETYRREMDVVDRFVTERCSQAPTDKAAAGAVYKAYRDWSQNAGEWTMKAADFTERLRSRPGVEHRRSSTGAFWIGLAIRSDGQ